MPISLSLEELNVKVEKQNWPAHKPEWFRMRLPSAAARFGAVQKTISESRLHTVCEEAKCPNIGECWSTGTATFMVLGDTCTRGCRFCAVAKAAKGRELDGEEPAKMALTVREWNETWKLDYIVITSVDRDDLPDQGANHFAECVRQVKKMNPGVIVELLIPDFRGERGLLEIVATSGAEVIGQNIETVERLTSIRDRRAGYQQTLDVLRMLKEINPNLFTKSAIMVGLGETFDEVSSTMDDLRDVGVDFLAIGQYLRPSLRQIEIVEYVHPSVFDNYEKLAMQKGFKYAACGPLVRSSYKAGEYFLKNIISKQVSVTS